LSQDVRNMLVVSEACTHAALARKESRGAHSRIDFPQTDEAWGQKNHVIVNRRGEMTLFETPRPEMPDELKQLLAEEAVAAH
jgi:succinate dehydrogenase / fumarate reductase, flavoprotein subunit